VFTEYRKFPRTALNLPIEVEGYSCKNGHFVARAETVSVSPLGTAFLLSRALAVDDILLLTLPMPPQLRLFDFDHEQYRIYAQVRRVKRRPKGQMFTGVAFISQEAPASDFRSEPRTKTRVSLSIRGLSDNGQYFIEIIQTEDVSKHGLCFFTSRRPLKAGAIIELIGFQGGFQATAEVRHAAYNPKTKNYSVGARLSGEPQNWILK
jgi:hypothetical protein